MDLIYMNESKKDIDVLKDYTLDLAYGSDENDFECKVNINNNVCKTGYYLYFEGEEYGGVIDSVGVDTDETTVTYSGRTWHGILESKVLQPDEGEDYLIVSGEANEVLKLLIDRMGLSELFKVSTLNSKIQISSYQMNRYIKGYTGIIKMLKAYNAKLNMVFNRGFVELSASPLADYSQDEQFDTDQISFTIKRNSKHINHVICLGRGDLKDRRVIHIYCDLLGNISGTQTLTGLDEMCEIYDNSNAESDEDLIQGGIDKITESFASDSVDFSLDSNDQYIFDVNDKVGAREQITGTYVVASVSKKIVNISNNSTSISYDCEADTVSVSAGPYPSSGDGSESGQTVSIKIGSVTTGGAGSDAEVKNAGDNKNMILDFVIPKGDKGQDGAAGAKGEKGDQGDKGADGAPGADGKDGVDGKSISEVINYYLATSASSGVTAKTSGWTTTVQSVSASKKYLWNYEVVKLSDGTIVSTSMPCIIGAYGDRGNPGADGKDGSDGTNGTDGIGIKEIEEFYAVSTSNTKVPTSWSTTVPTMTATNKYLWNYETITYTNNTSVDTAKKVIGVYGDKGATGAKGDTGATGKGVKSTAVTYQASSSGTTTPTGTWSTTIPTVSAGQYLWTRTIITYTDNTTSTSYSVGRNGTNGTNGTNGKDGAAGKGIKSTVVAYQVGASGTTVPTGTWSTSIPAADTSKPYLWTRTIITYTDNTTSTSYSVGATPEGMVQKKKIISEINQSAEEISIKAEKISLEGLVTANENFKVLEDGSIEAKNGKFTGEIYATSGKFEGEIVSSKATITGGSMVIQCSNPGDKVIDIYWGNPNTEGQDPYYTFQITPGSIYSYGYNGGHTGSYTLDFDGLTFTGAGGSIYTPGSISCDSIKASGNLTVSGTINGMKWNWSGQGGQPSWLWGGNDGANMYVYNPSDFSVNYAKSANYANSAGGISAPIYGYDKNVNITCGGWNTPASVTLPAGTYVGIVFAKMYGTPASRMVMVFSTNSGATDAGAYMSDDNMDRACCSSPVVINVSGNTNFYLRVYNSMSGVRACHCGWYLVKVK